MTPELFFLLALFHGAVALVTTGTNLLLNHRRLTSAAHRDIVHLRLALAAELANLRALYRDNIAAIRAGQEALASARMLCVIYRANLGRMHLLPAEAVGDVVTAYALCERAEAFAAVHCKAHGASAFSMGRDRAFADALTALYEQASARAQQALVLLGEPAVDAPAAIEPVTAPVRRLKAA